MAVNRVGKTRGFARITFPTGFEPKELASVIDTLQTLTAFYWPKKAGIDSLPFETFKARLNTHTEFRHKVRDAVVKAKERNVKKSPSPA